MDGERAKLAPPCPSCGRPMGLTRTIPGSPGLSELQTYGCKACGVWVTETKDRRNQREGQFSAR